MLSVPRLRLSRNLNAYENPVTGSPQNDLLEFANRAAVDPMGRVGISEGEDTPKANSSAIVEPTETPASRLRALLSSASAPSGKSTSTLQSRPQPSENESDFDPLDDMSNTTPSLARESLRDVFARAYRDTDKPLQEKIRTRRNSIDTSEVEATPRLRREKAKIKVNRKSFSDEELDGPSKYSRLSETSFRSSQAATFDILRERLDNSQIKDIRPPTTLYEQTPTADANTSTSRILRELNPPTASIPSVVSSTPQQSLRMSMTSDFQFQSNLLGDDSEMQRAIEEYETFGMDDSDRHPVSFSSGTSTIDGQKGLARMAHEQSTPDVRGGQASPGVPGAENNVGIPLSGLASFLDVHMSEGLDSFHEKEWNRPRTPQRSDIPDLSPRSSQQPAETASSLNDPGSRKEQSTQKIDKSFDDLETSQEHQEGSKQHRNKLSARLSRPTPSTGSHISEDTERNVKIHQLRGLQVLPTRLEHQTPVESSRADPPVNSLHGGSYTADELGEESTRKRQHDRGTLNLQKSRSFSPSPSGPENQNMEAGSSSRGHNDRVSRSASPASGSQYKENIVRPVRVMLDRSDSSLLSPPIGSDKGKGKVAEPDHASPEASTVPAKPSPTSKFKFGLHDSFSFIKNRTHLPPINFDNIRESTPSHRTASSSLSSSASANSNHLKSGDIAKEVKSHLDPGGRRLVSQFSKKRALTEAISPLETQDGSLGQFPSPSSPRGDGTWNRKGTSSVSSLSVNRPTNSTVLQELSPPPSPPTQTHLPDSSSQQSYPHDPQPSLRAQSPPTSLPGSPLSSSADGNDVIASHTPRHRSQPNLSAFHTPRPPGAWASTPGSRLQHDFEPASSIQSDEEPGDGDAGTPGHRLTAAGFASVKTPRPPGAWSTPSSKEPLPVSFSPGDVLIESDSGLATPVDSLSKHSLYSARTPRPPGAWMTPSTRKSILKVRFDTQDDFSLNELATNGASKELPISVSPHPKRRQNSPQKSPGIRVLDAFGREVLENEVTLRPASSIRVLDAMGRELPEGESEEPYTPKDHREALAHVRRGLAELAEDLDEMDRMDGAINADHTYIKELQDASAAAKAIRTELIKVASNGTSYQRGRPSQSSMPKTLATISSIAWLWQRPWVLGGLFLVQLLIALFLYRVTVMRAEDLFLFTYYDPFYPDLHLYPVRPDMIRLSMLSSKRSWLSIISTSYHQGWRALTQELWKNLSIATWDLQQLLWETLNHEAPQSYAWPPT